MVPPAFPSQAEQWRQLFEAITDAVMVLDRDHRVIETNAATAALLGLDREAILGRRCYEVVHQRDAPRPGCTVKRTLASGRREQGEFWVEHLNRHLRSVAYPLTDEAGEVTHVVHILRDITERREAEAKMSQQREELQTILDSVPAMVFYKDKNDRFLRVNKALAQAFQMSKEEITGETAAELSPGKDYWKDDKRVMETGVPLKNIIEHIETPEGTKWVQTDKIPYRDSKGEIIGIIGFAQDITARKAAEERVDHLNLVLRAVRNVNQLITREKDRGRLLEGTCEELVKTRGYSSAWIALLDEQRKFVTSAQSGLGRSFAPLRKRLKRGELIECGREALAQPEVVAITDPPAECGDCPLLGQEPENRTLTVRLAHGEQVYGVMSVSLPQGLAADREEQALFREVADDIAFALHGIEVAEQHEKAEAALRESEERFRSLVETATDAIVNIDDRGRITLWNRAATRFFGFTRKEALGADFYAQMVPERYRKKVKTGLVVFRKGGKGKLIGRTIELTGVRKDGSEFPIELSVSRFRRGDEWHATGIIRDITARKVTETALRDSEARFRGAFENAAVGVMLVDTEGRFVRANQALCDLLGYTETELRARTFSEVTHPDDIHIGNYEMQRMLSGEAERAKFEKRYIHQQGHEVWVLVSPSLVRDSDDKPFYFVTQVQDLTDRREALAALRRSEARYRSTIDSMKDIVFGIDRDGRFRDYHGPVDAKLPVPSEVFIGRHFEEMLQPHVAASLAEAIAALAAGARSREFEYSLEMDGQTCWYYAVVSGRRDAGGAFDGVTAVVHDITAHKTMEAQLIQSERLAAIGEVALGVAHELNTPLANISLLADNLIEMGDDDDIKAMARQTQGQVDFAARIVKELLNFARPATYEFSELDLNAVIETSLAQLQTPDNVAVDFDPAGELLAVRGARYQLQEIITNLANNAFYAMRRQRRGRLTVTTRPRGERVELVVADSGTGIPPEHLRRVFDPFYSTKPAGHGTGLGLSIVQRIVHAHGGTLSVASGPGRGATFTIRLPFLTEADEAEAAATTRDEEG